MQVYPNFSTPTMNNPYQNYGQPMQNPYMAQMGQYQQNFQPQIQQPQPQQQTTGLVGRVVNDFSEVKADDVPMNGTPAIFIKGDMSEIEVRIWGNDGLIHPTPYKPILEQNQSEGTNIPQMDFNALNDGIMALGNNIMERIDKLEKSLDNSSSKATKTSTRAKKEVVADE